MARLRVLLFGAFDAYLDGQLVTGFQSDKARALLAYLSVEADHGHRRQKLAGMFWPDMPEKVARTNLRNALSNLRKVLRDAGNSQPYFLVEPDQIRFDLDSSVWVDAIEFSRLNGKADASISDLENAVQLQQQPFLQGFSLPGCPEFESWALLTHQVLEQKLATILSQLCRQYELRGDLARSIEFARRLNCLDPFDEQSLRTLLRLLAQNGERSAALEQFQTFRKVLADELWVEPEVETIRLVEEIRTGKAGMHPNNHPAIHHMPIYLTRFFGRQDEISLVCDLLKKERLVTLTGSGGVGKTRLALMAAEAAQPDFPDGIWFIPLATLADPDLVVQQIAQDLGFREEDEGTGLEMIGRYLRSRSALLLIDNCEHLLDKVAWVVETLLAACPRLVILTTSRQPLGLFGETIIRAPSLPFPPQETDISLPKIAAFASISLFMDRARQAKQDFVIDEDNCPSIVRICRRLDGVPLALELAAVRLDILDVAELATRLDQAFDLLTAGSRTAIQRHQTLRATLDWSYRLLRPKEALLMRRLAVFAIDWSLAGAEGVCVGEGIEKAEIIALLSGLVEKSLVDVIQVQGRQTRYRMLEVIRQYAQEELITSAETELLQRRHLAYYLTMIEARDPESRGQNQMDWILNQEAEQANFRQALAFALETDPKSGLILALWLSNYWTRRGHDQEGTRWLKAFLMKPENISKDTYRAAGLLNLCFQSPAEPNSERWARESLAIFRESGDIPGQAWANYAWGWCRTRHEDFPGARPHFETACDIFEELHDQNGLAKTLRFLSRTYQFTGPVSMAIKLGEQSLAMERQLAYLSDISYGCEFLAEMVMLSGDLKRARDLIEEAELILKQIEPGGYRQGLAYNRAYLDCWSGNYEAVRLTLSIMLERNRRYLADDAFALIRFAQGYFLCLLGQAQEGKKWLEEGVRIYKTSRLMQYDLQYQQTYLMELTRACVTLGEIDRARQLLDEYRHLYQLSNYLPNLHALMGQIALSEGQGDLAFEHYIDSLRFANLLEFRLQTLLALEGCAWALASCGLATRAASLLGAVEEFRQRSGAVIFPRDRPLHDKIVVGLKGDLGEKGYDTGWMDGFQAGFEQSIREILSDDPDKE